MTSCRAKRGFRELIILRNANYEGLGIAKNFRKSSTVDLFLVFKSLCMYVLRMYDIKYISSMWSLGENIIKMPKESL